MRRLSTSEYVKLKVLDQKVFEFEDISVEGASALDFSRNPQEVRETLVRVTEDHRDIINSILKRSNGYGVFLIDSEFSVDLRDMALKLLRDEELDN